MAKLVKMARNFKKCIQIMIILLINLKKNYD